MTNRLLAAAAFSAALVTGLAALAGASFRFNSIDGGTIDLNSFSGRPVLVVNTASLCGFSGQYDDLQALQDTYGTRGLVVVAIPSNDFNQELPDDAAVKEYCAANFDLTLPMTEITSVTGSAAHPFYIWLKEEYGFVPGWNFNKVLLGPEGDVVATWGSVTNPTSAAITSKIEPLLN
jgi:glutathione peroxidase